MCEEPTTNGISLEGCFQTFDSPMAGYDDEKILSEIIEKYPAFLTSNPDKILKKIFLDFMQDRKFIKHLTDYYQTNLKELVRIIYNHYPFLFSSTMYVKKINMMVKKSTFLKRQAKKPLN